MTDAPAGILPSNQGYLPMTTSSPSGILRVGISGHRHLGPDPRTAWYVHAECVRLLEHLRHLAHYRGASLEAVSALAIGADTLFAQAALGLGLPLLALLPFEEYVHDFPEGPERDLFLQLRSLCREETSLPNRKRSNTAYLAVGKKTVEMVDYLVAVWDGQPARGKGGTADVVAYAERKGKPVLRIDPARALVGAR
jgi:hypothetical protein